MQERSRSPEGAAFRQLIISDRMILMKLHFLGKMLFVI